ncbi:hypothetical protein FOMPIDRAFT_1170901 [Fomitopsis schrenkii]|uniref:Thioester reductase (TE) domain-containing protein n=1 Tax=Fomitopsis schrenkii TaxID=2126942 RepID=S8DGS2_FOMSC|nr:hypothetical protein FOMPIDRAFT_1170901 [Fomitopsis schrenkii]
MQLLGDMTFAALEAHVMKTQQSKHEEGAASASNVDVAAGAAELERMIKKYSIGFDADAKRPTGPLLPDAVVLVTGTTGGLGSYFLAQLLVDDRVSRVYAFNRPSESSIAERQTAGFKARELDVSLLSSSKLVYVEGDAAAGQLGLVKEMYERLRQEVTVIIHNAWRLDLNAPLKTFVPNIAGTRNLLDLARSSPHADSVRFAFISTIGTTQNWRDLSKLVPEEIVEDASLAVMRGYGEGKYVAERIVAASGIQSSVFRVGQLSGADDTGAWSITEWIPSIVKSSLKLGTLPDAGGVISWLPMNKTAPVVLDTVFSTNSPPAVLNVVHPRPVTWHTLMSNLATSLSAATPDRKFELVPFLDWIDQLEKLSLTLSVEEARAIVSVCYHCVGCETYFSLISLR